ncbi:DMT family transporter [Chloroflexota bacterium]
MVRGIDLRRQSLYSSQVMLIGPLLAFIAAFLFGLNDLFTRRAVLRVKDISAGVAVSVLISVPVLFLALIISGKVGDLLRFPWHGYLWLLGAGLIQQYVARHVKYKTVQLVGANISSILMRSQPLVAVSLGVFVLGEVVSLPMLLGILLIVAGGGLVGGTWQPLQSSTSSVSLSPKSILMGVGAGVCMGVSTLMIKVALNSFSSPIAALFISFIGGAIVHVIIHAKGDKRILLLNMDKGTFWLFSLIGLLVVFAQLSRYFALGMSSISVVSPIFSVTPLMVLGLSYIFNRKLEVFSKSVLIAAVIVVIGSLLLLWGRP